MAKITISFEIDSNEYDNFSQILASMSNYMDVAAATKLAGGSVAPKLDAKAPAAPVVPINSAPGYVHRPEPKQPTQEQLEAREALSRIDPEILARAAAECDGDLESIPGQLAVANEAVKEFVGEPLIVSAETAAAEEAPARKRRTRKDVSLDTPAEKPKPEDPPGSFVLPEPDTTSVPAAPPDGYRQIPEAQPVIEGLPTPQQLTEFRTRVTEYTNDVLPKAGMVPSENIGGIAIKVRLYAKKMFKVADIKQMTTAQWEAFFKHLGDTVQTDGAPKLVELIDKTVGA